MSIAKSLDANSRCFRGLNPSFHHCYVIESSQSEEATGFILVFEFIIVILGIVGNICLILLMRRKRFSSEYFPVYLISLAVSDCLNLIISLASDVMELLKKEGFSTIAASQNHCVILFMATSISSLASPWLIVHLTYDCFLSSCFPFNKFTSRRHGYIMASCTAILSIVVTALFATSYKEVTDYQCELKIFPEPIKAELLWLIICNIIPMCLILGLCVTIYCGFRKSDRLRYLERCRWNLTEVLICYIALMCFVEWIPGSIISAVKTSYEIKGLPSPSVDFLMTNIWQVCLMLYLVSYSQNFYILVLMSPKYRLEFLKMVGFKKDGDDPHDVFGLDSDNDKTPMLSESET